MGRRDQRFLDETGGGRSECPTPSAPHPRWCPGGSGGGGSSGTKGGTLNRTRDLEGRVCPPDRRVEVGRRDRGSGVVCRSGRTWTGEVSAGRRTSLSPDPLRLSSVLPSSPESVPSPPGRKVLLDSVLVGTLSGPTTFPPVGPGRQYPSPGPRPRIPIPSPSRGLLLLLPGFSYFVWGLVRVRTSEAGPVRTILQ